MDPGSGPGAGVEAGAGLEGRRLRVIVTRPVEQAGELARRIEGLGHEAVLCPLIEIEAVGPETIDTAGYDWVVVTSPRAARELARRRHGELQQVAAIGPGTAAVLREHGIEPALVPKVSTQEGLVAELPDSPGRVLFAGAEDARPYLAKELGADTVVLYRTRALRPAEPPEGDVVVLASASAARAYADLALGLPAVSIGPETTREARAHGIEVIREAETHDLDGLVAAISAIRL